MPKIANYMRDGVKAKSVAVVWVNNDFGKGGRDASSRRWRRATSRSWPTSRPRPARPTSPPTSSSSRAPMPTRSSSTRNEEESARFLREARKQGLNEPLIGETTLLGQKVIELAGDAANGVKGHVGLTADAPVPAIEEFGKKYEKRVQLQARPQRHQGLHRASTRSRRRPRRAGKFDGKAFAAALHGMTITPDKMTRHPDRGDLGRQRRDRPHQLPRRGHGRQAEDHRGPAEAGEVSRA